MVRAVRVVVESPLLQLDREFDYLVPDELGDLSFGQRVSFPFGRSKKPLTGFVTEILTASEFAKSYLTALVDPKPVLHPDIFQFARQVADRQCVAIGEILATAVPPHMPRITVNRPEKITQRPGESRAVFRNVLLSSGKQVDVSGQLFPQWALRFIELAQEQFATGHSALLLVPEEADVEMLIQLANERGLEHVALLPSDRKSIRFQKFHTLFDQTAVVIGTRSAIYAPVANLGLIAVSDDLDESYREVGSPHTHLRDLALIRAGETASLLFAAPYRSVELQRLVEIGFLKEVEEGQKPLRISFTEPGLRVDESAFRLLRDALSDGPLLILLPRKGMSSAIWCAGCGERQRCDCGGYVWEPKEQDFRCRICEKRHLLCHACQGRSFKGGRQGSSRTVAEIGRAFPKAAVFEATAEKKPANLGKPNQILIATPGSAPRIKGGYAGMVILDPEVWLNAQHLAAESFALRDWCEAMELLNPKARVVISGLGAELGQPLSLWQHQALAKAALQDARALGLPPAIRSVSVEGAPQSVGAAVGELTELGARLLRQSSGQALLSFSYQDGPKIAKALRAHALATNAREVSGSKRRGLRIVMDPLGVI